MRCAMYDAVRGDPFRQKVREVAASEFRPASALTSWEVDHTQSVEGLKLDQLAARLAINSVTLMTLLHSTIGQENN